MAEVAPVAAIKGAPKARKPSGPSVAELLTQAVSASKERGGVSLAALKKSLAASGYDVERNNSRIKVGLKGLVSRGTLLQTKGTGASGSFKLNKQQAGAREKAAPKKAPPPAAKGRKPPAAAKGAKKAAKAKKPVKKAAAGAPKKVAKSPKKAKITKPKKTPKSPAKRPLKPKAKAKAKVVSRKK